MSKSAKTRKKLERVKAKKQTKALRMVHKDKKDKARVSGRKKLVERQVSGNIGDYKNPKFRDLNMPFLAKMRILELQGVHHQYTSKCPRAKVDKYILDHYIPEAVHNFFCEQPANRRSPRAVRHVRGAT